MERIAAIATRCHEAGAFDVDTATLAAIMCFAAAP
jgi:hypothetical protein